MRDAWVWWALALLALGGGTVVIAEKTRGLRNKNPGNLRHSPQQWDGEIKGTDPDFKSFSEHRYGIRAIAKLLKNYQRLYGINNVAGLINRWAPGHENPTDAYVAYVAKAAGVEPTQKINVQQHLPALVSAIIKFENGINPYTADQINEGIALA